MQLSSTGKEIIGLEILIISKDSETEAFQFNEHRHAIFLVFPRILFFLRNTFKIFIFEIHVKMM